MVTPKKMNEFRTAIFQFGDKKPKIKFGSKNKIMIFTVDNNIKIGMKVVNN